MLSLESPHLLLNFPRFSEAKKKEISSVGVILLNRNNYLNEKL